MKLITGAVLLLISGAGIWFFAMPKPADEYALPMADVYSRLAAVSVAYNSAGNDKAAFGGHSVIPNGNGSDRIVWTVGHTAPLDCTISLSALAANKTKVAVSCDEPADKKAMLAAMRGNEVTGANMGEGSWIIGIRNDVIEKIDSTLNGLPYDDSKSAQVAWRWPDDVVHHAGLAETMGPAVGNAIKMDMEENNRRMAEQQAQASGHSDDNGEGNAPVAAWTPPADPNAGANPWAKR